MSRAADLTRLVEDLRRIPDLVSASKGDEFYYASVPLCVLDAVFSINARYEGVQNLIGRYCAHFGVPRTRSGPELPPRYEQLTVSGLVKQVEGAGLEHFTEG